MNKAQIELAMPLIFNQISQGEVIKKEEIMSLFAFLLKIAPDDLDYTPLCYDNVVNMDDFRNRKGCS